MKIYKFKAVSDSGHNLEAIISADEWEIDWILGQEVIFGDGRTEGKVTIAEEHFRVLTEDKAEVSTIVSVISSFGDDPFDFLTTAQLTDYDAAARERRIALESAKTERARVSCAAALNSNTCNR